MIPEDNPRVRDNGRRSRPPHRNPGAKRRSEARPLGEANPSAPTSEPGEDDRGGYEEPAGIRLRDPDEVQKKSIDMLFDLDDPEQAEVLEGHGTAFGQGHTEVEPLGEGKIVLKIYPGGTKGLR